MPVANVPRHRILVKVCLVSICQIFVKVCHMKNNLSDCLRYLKKSAWSTEFSLVTGITPAGLPATFHTPT